jgi:integrase
MKLPAGVVKRRNSYFARIHTKGGEKSYPLGPDPDVAVATFYQVKADILAGRDPRAQLPEKPPEELTVAAAVAQWLRDKVDLELKRGADIHSRTERSLLPFLGKRALKSLRRSDCHAYLAHVRRGNPDYMPATVEHYMRTLREFLNWCVDVELLDSSPWPTKKGFVPHAENSAPDRQDDHAVAILVALPEPWGFHQRLLVAGGFRWSEAIALERTDLTPDGQLLIRKAKDKEFRAIPIPRSLLLEIMGRKGRLFVTREGKPYSRNSKGGYAQTIRRLAAKAVAKLPKEERDALQGLQGYHPHQMRHSFGCRYLEAGGALVALQEILGHSTVRMTQRYGRLNEKAIRADATRVFEAWETPDREQNREHPQIRPFTASGGKC